MNALTKRLSIKTFHLLFLILLICLFVSENVFSKDSWKRDFTTITYNPSENSISIRFIVFDYQFGTKHGRAYLKSCYFLFSSDNKFYNILMCVDTQDQIQGRITECQMKLKNTAARLQFAGYCEPNSWWIDNNDVTVSVQNVLYAHEHITKYNTRMKLNKYNATCTVKWFLDEKFKNVKRIRLYGEWNVIGGKIQPIHSVDYNRPKRKKLKSKVDQLDNNRVKVAANADAIVITGACNGENIKVYNLTGVEVQSTVAKRDVVNIKLPKNQIYYVHIGQTCYKVAM